MIGKVIGIIIVILGGIGAGIWYGDIPSQDHQKEGRVGVVSRSDIVKRITLAGKAASGRSVKITAPYNGYVKKVFVKVGDWVKPNTPIVTLVESIVSQSSEAFPLRSPVYGQVVNIGVSEGENVGQGDAGQAMVFIEDTREMYIEADVSEIDYIDLKIGQKTTIRPNSMTDKTYSGIITEIGLAAKETESWSKNKVLFPVKIKLTDHDESLRPGMSVIVDVIAYEKKDILTLPHEFVEGDRGRYFVVTAKGERREITVGIQDSLSKEILSGLVEGEQIKQIDFLAQAKRSNNANN